MGITEAAVARFDVELLKTGIAVRPRGQPFRASGRYRGSRSGRAVSCSLRRRGVTDGRLRPGEAREEGRGKVDWPGWAVGRRGHGLTKAFTGKLGSWEHLGVQPDLSAWSKAIANGYALGAVLGVDALRDAAANIYVTGSFWFSAVSMAAALATLGVVQDEDTVGRMVKMGTLLRDGLAAQAESRGLMVHLSGPPQMPFLTFDDDHDYALADLFADRAVRGGVWLHPRHNWFVSGAMTETDVEQTLRATDAAFAAVAAGQ